MRPQRRPRMGMRVVQHAYPFEIAASNDKARINSLLEAMKMKPEHERRFSPQHFIFPILIALALAFFPSCSSGKSSGSRDSSGSGGGAGTGSGTGGGNGSGTGTGSVNRSELETEVFNIVNQERAAQGLPPLIWDDEVAAVARGHSECQRDHNDQTHDCNYGHGQRAGDRLANAGVMNAGWGENIVSGIHSAAGAMNSWMNSPSHRSTILHTAWTHMGVGLAMPGAYWTQVFIRK
ncbi:MAG: CAP domain-containing protein [Planctomycetota bacterium]|nr:MAG: CAP domain-containing protein [Planctomycetota bacterium]